MASLIQQEVDLHPDCTTKDGQGKEEEEQEEKMANLLFKNLIQEQLPCCHFTKTRVKQEEKQG